VPGDLSIVGIDNLEMLAHLFPALTTMHLPVARIGELAAESLLAQLRSDGAAAHVELPVELVVRRSTRRWPEPSCRAQIFQGFCKPQSDRWNGEFLAVRS
jgi:DNA-binding LacI/PurR family transcriptional regulator